MEWKLSDSLRGTYTDWFLQQSHGRDSVPICRFFRFMESLNVKERMFDKIWTLCVKDSTAIRLQYSKFIVAAFVADKVAHGALIPDALPQSLMDTDESLIGLVPRNSSEEEELRELSGSNGLGTDTAQEALFFLNTSFGPLRCAVWRILCLLSLHVPNRKSLATLSTPDLLLKVISSNLGETTKMHAAVCLCSLTAMDSMWLSDLVCLTTTMARNVSASLSACLLASIANSIVSVSVFDRLSLTKPPYGCSGSYMDELMDCLNSPRLTSAVLEELLRIFLNIAYLYDTKPVEFVSRIFKSSNKSLLLLTPSSCVFLCELLCLVPTGDLHVFSCLLTMIDPSVLLHATVADSLTTLLLVTTTIDTVDDRVELVKMVFYQSINEIVIVERCMRIVSESLGARDQVGLLRIAQAVCNIGPLQSVLLGLDCWRSILAKSRLEFEGSAILGSLLRGGNSEIVLRVLTILSANTELVRQNDFRPYWSDLLHCAFADLTTWPLPVAALVPLLEEEHLTELTEKCLTMMNSSTNCLHLVNALALASVRLIKISKISSLRKQTVLPHIVGYLSESFPACLACAAFRFCPIEALADPKTPVSHLRVLLTCVTPKDVLCVPMLLRLVVRHEPTDIMETSVSHLKQILSNNPLLDSLCAEFVPSRLQALANLMASGKSQEDVFAIFLQVSLSGRTALVVNAVGVGAWFLDWLLQERTVTRLGMVALLVSTHSRFCSSEILTWCVSELSSECPIREYLALHVIEKSNQAVSEEVATQIWKRVLDQYMHLRVSILYTFLSANSESNWVQHNCKNSKTVLLLSERGPSCGGILNLITAMKKKCPTMRNS